jgi:NAD(P)-dependent dehydrogenase (short-subunit alcohol dehydrogenase family)
LRQPFHIGELLGLALEDLHEFAANDLNQAIPRIGRPEEIAAFIAWLLSDEASYQTGGVYPVDGGFTI